MTHFDPSDLLDLAPADGEERTFLASHVRRASEHLFTVACAPPAMMRCSFTSVWRLYGSAVDWSEGETRALPTPMRVTATWSSEDAWVVTKVEKL